MNKRRTHFVFLRRRGIALVLVVITMTIAAILAYAMLSSTTLQSTASANSINAAVADAQAESGIQLALYYLQNPDNAPPNIASGTPFTTTFAATGQSAIPGSVTITVTAVANSTNLYSVKSVGSSQGSSVGGGAITRTINATIQVNTKFPINQAVGSNGAIAVVGNGIFSNGNTNGIAAITGGNTVAINAGGTVNGGITSPNQPTGSGTFNGIWTPVTSTTPAPDSQHINDFAYTATAVAKTTITSSDFPPGTTGVFYYPNSVTISGSNFQINGTLIVNGNLSISGTGITITPQKNMPALIVMQNLQFNNSNKDLTINGVAWVNSGIKGALGAKLTINGALLLGSGNITLTFSSLKVTYDPNPDVTNISNLIKPQSVQITNWSQSVQ